MEDTRLLPVGDCMKLKEGGFPQEGFFYYGRIENDWYLSVKIEDKFLCIENINNATILDFEEVVSCPMWIEIESWVCNKPCSIKKKLEELLWKRRKKDWKNCLPR